MIFYSQYEGLLKKKKKKKKKKNEEFFAFLVSMLEIAFP